MGRRPNHGAAVAFERGFALGRLLESGVTLTTSRIREQFRVSRATAKRDLRAVRAIADPACDVSENGERRVYLERE